MAPSHAEIWDDSALVDSWNEALDEYKVETCVIIKAFILTSEQKYHSISSKGENVAEVIARASNEENAT